MPVRRRSGVATARINTTSIQVIAATSKNPGNSAMKNSATHIMATIVYGMIARFFSPRFWYTAIADQIVRRTLAFVEAAGASAAD